MSEVTTMTSFLMSFAVLIILTIFIAICAKFLKELRQLLQ